MFPKTTHYLHYMINKIETKASLLNLILLVKHNKMVMVSYETRMKYSFLKEHIIHIIGTTV